MSSMASRRDASVVRNKTADNAVFLSFSTCRTALGSGVSLRPDQGCPEAYEQSVQGRYVTSTSSPGIRIERAPPDSAVAQESPSARPTTPPIEEFRGALGFFYRTITTPR